MATQIMHDQDFRDSEKWDHVVAAGDVYLPMPQNEKKSMAAVNAKINSSKDSTGNLDGKKRAQYCIYGKYESLDEAKKSEFVFNPDGYEKWNMTYSKRFGAMLPTSVVAMLNGQNISIQRTTGSNGKMSIRILGTVDSLESWKELGFRATITSNGKTENLDKSLDNNGVITTKEAWISVKAAGATVSAEKLNGNYIYFVVVDDVVTTGATLNVAFYAKDTSGKVYDFGGAFHMDVEDIKN